MTIKIILADDHPIFRMGLRAAVERQPECSVVAEAGSPHELLDLLGKNEYDLLITDFMMPAEHENDGLRMLERINRFHPDLPSIVVTMLNNPGLYASIMNAGVKGLVSKSSVADEMPAAINAVMRGDRFMSRSVQKLMEAASGHGSSKLAKISELSPKELEVVRLLASGLGVGEIARRLSRSKQTVSAQKVSAMRKLGVVNDAALFIYIQEHGLLF